jgi:hypothetical protein
MIKTFTPNDIIRYVYDETLEEENKLIASLLLTDTELQEFYYELLAVKKDLNQLIFKPSKSSTQYILDYSRTFNSIHSE